MRSAPPRAGAGKARGLRFDGALSPTDARAVVDAYAPWCADGITPADLSAAFRIEDEALLRFWGALIVAVARRSGALRVLSEDLNAG